MAAKLEVAKTSDIFSFVKKQAKLLELERNAEINESVDARRTCSVKDLEKRGICVSKLHITSECTGLYGKHLVSFGRGKEKRSKGNEKTSQNANDQIVSHCISSGDIVGVQTSSSEMKEGNIASGIVTKVSDDVIVVAFEEELESSSSSDTFALIKLCNDVTYKRLKVAIETLNNTKKHSHLKDVLFHQMPLGVPLMLLKEDNFHLFDVNLNQCQIEAVKFALNQKEIGIIHGPPGTGKTTTVIEIIKQAVKCFKFKVLACAPSNVAVDNLVAKLVGSNVKVVRLGHPARVYPHLQKYSLDAVLMNSDSAEIVKNVREDIQRVLEKIKKCKDASNARKLRGELGFLKKELFEMERKVLQSVLASADVILATTTSASIEGPLKHLNAGHFDLVIIDEAAQALEASCWIPLSHGNRCILAGDHKQLPPTIISQEAARKGLEITLMERSIIEFGDPIVRMLTSQYRMNRLIMEWPSRQLYNGKLKADDSVESHLLSDLPDVSSDENTSIPLLFVDTAGCCMYELKQENEESKGNEYEAQLVVSHVEALLKAGVKEESIGIITPYNLQVELIRKALLSRHPHLEIRSVDGFQGREKEAIVISLVRSNDEGEVGFLKEDRRINVAITRARRHLAVIGDSSTMQHHNFLKSFFDYVSDYGEVRPAQSYTLAGVTKSSDDATNELLQGFDAFKIRNSRLKGVASSDGSVSQDFENTISTSNGSYSKGTQDWKRSTNSRDYLSERQGNSFTRECKVMDDNSHMEKKSINLTGEAAKTSEYTEEAIEKMVVDFINSETENTLIFDSSLVSRERFWVHRMAEKYGLAHWSGGEGKERCITIKKRTKKQSNANDVGDGGVLDEDFATCPNCSKAIPRHNLELHSLRCSKSRGTNKEMHLPKKDVKKKAGNEGKKKAGNEGKKKAGNEGKKKAGNEGQKKADEDDVDALIAQFAKDDSTCSFDKCKNSVLTLGQKCKFCVRRFCVKHGLAEVHGCGEAAKIDARKSFDKSVGKAKTRPLNDIQKKCVKKRLNEKIVEMEKKRTGSIAKNK